MAVSALLNYSITFVCLVGLGLSIYAYIVELQVENNSEYQPMCDISERVSCSKAFQSRYGKGFGLVPQDSFFNKPNSLVGVLYYSLAATLAQSNSLLITRLLFWATVLSNLASIYFAYILYFVLYNLCIVCVSTYVVNALCLLATNVKLRALTQQHLAKKSS